MFASVPSCSSGCGSGNGGGRLSLKGSAGGGANGASSPAVRRELSRSHLRSGVQHKSWALRREGNGILSLQWQARLVSLTLASR